MTLLDRLARGETIEVPVHGHSMRPVLRDGDSVRVRPLGPAEPRRGQIVLKVQDGQWVLHRLLRCNERRVKTRGDARLFADAPSERAAVLGVAVAVRCGPAWLPLSWPRAATSVWMRLTPVAARLREARDRRRRRRRRHSTSA